MTAPSSITSAAPPVTALERAGFLALLGFVGALQVSIFAAQTLLVAALLLWIALLATRRERFEAPKLFWPLVAYAGATLVACVLSVDPRTSFPDAKQLLLFLIVPAVYRLARGARGLLVVDVIISVGAVSAAYGIVQYGILNFDHLQQRPQGALSHYMTYSGLLMLVVCAALARVLLQREGRTWPALVLPALLVAIVLTFTRNALVGACVGAGLLFALRDFRLMALLPVAAAVFVALAPARLSDRVYSVFNLTDASSRDRVAMLRSGARIVADHPLAGVGPDVVIQVYPQYREPSAVEQRVSHLHNVPLQIAAERGLPALGLWIWFIVQVVRDLVRVYRTAAFPSLAGAGLAAVAAMLAAGMFEYNFGDSEFLMLFLVLVTLPLAAARQPPGPHHAVSEG
jgi:O-antigen ligase